MLSDFDHNGELNRILFFYYTLCFPTWPLSLIPNKMSNQGSERSLNRSNTTLLLPGITVALSPGMVSVGKTSLTILAHSVNARHMKTNLEACWSLTKCGTPNPSPSPMTRTLDRHRCAVHKHPRGKSARENDEGEYGTYLNPTIQEQSPSEVSPDRRF